MQTTEHSETAMLGHARRLLLLVASALLLVACSFGEELEADDSVTDGSGAVSYVSLRIAPAGGPATRAGDGPTGGEDGDGREPGQSYENDVTTVTAFLFASDEGINAPAATPSEAVVTFTRLTQEDADDPYSNAYRTATVPVGLQNGTYRVLVLANGGDIAWATDNAALTLGDVRDHIYNGAAWGVGDDGSYAAFVMASAYDATVTLANNPADDPATVDVSVERLAARVDYQEQGRYTCAEGAVFRGTVEIKGAVLVNNLTSGSYLFKRTADDATGTVNLRYLGRETATDGVATNYVIDPWTVSKTDTMGGLPACLYGLRLGSYATSADWMEVIREGTPVTDVNSETWMRIGYTLENTLPADSRLRDYATGVVFRAQFKPAEGSVIGNYEPGRTFFCWNGALYATCRDVMEAYWGKNGAVDNAETAVMACKTWGDLRTVANSGLRAGDPTGYVAWLRSCVDGHSNDGDVLTDAGQYTWTAYMQTVCGYTVDAGGVVQIDGNNKNTRQLLAAHNVRTYRDATCYYTYWIRHGGAESSDATMKHAIVRNNIYKLRVDAVHDLGDDLPGETPLVVTVYVNDWTLLPAETLPM